ncbi:rho GTPase-activating protein 32 isoform X3 [Brienomyrus brachyistius]|nr:rho GTPase-activating protein 32 isoform X3 [Brienomyrus brachyistius]XP_048836376.1 rho GTPase-activating protein 32 isoform X3 [Brienomyrus brachyistius]
MEVVSENVTSPLGSLGASGSHHTPKREDSTAPKSSKIIHPGVRSDWEDTISAMARGSEDLTNEPLVRSGISTASMKVKTVRKSVIPAALAVVGLASLWVIQDCRRMLIGGVLCFFRLSITKGHFPKLAECAHFHYDNVEFGTVQLALADEQKEMVRNGFESQELLHLVHIGCQGNSWVVRRTYEDFRVLDKHLHLCIFDRHFSQLAELPRLDSLKDNPEAVFQMLIAYLSRLSAIADNKINCGPALTWMEIDNKGNHLLGHDESSINVPAIAAAHVIKRYSAQAADELSFEVGDMVSVIDMPPKEDTTWWRGKHGFQVGFFPSECVELINDKLPQSVTSAVPKPVCKKHGKIITFLRSFMKSRPSKQKLKQRGILRERVFGCDLGEHLLNSGQDVPQVLKSCTEFIEKHGVVDGIYRLSGIASNIQKLRHEFDSEQIPDLTKDVYLQDIHCVGSLCKLYFRELPNPLLTYQLYHKFSDAVTAATDEERLIKIHDVIQQLPPPHYRTFEFLMKHLSHLATFSSVTNMHTKNLAIVWAPNLLRSKQIESACFGGTAAFMEVRIQSVVMEFILNHVDSLFSSKLSSVIREGAGQGSLSRPKSLLVSSPSSKLLTLEEAQARTQVQMNSPDLEGSQYIEVGDGPGALQGKFHTVIELPTERKRSSSKLKMSPVGGWRAFFSLGKSQAGRRKPRRNPSMPAQTKGLEHSGGRADRGSLRSARSEESLTSLQGTEGTSGEFRSRRPRSSSDAPSALFSTYNSTTQGQNDASKGPITVPVLISSPCFTDDVDLILPDMSVGSLDFDPMSFQFSTLSPRPSRSMGSTSSSELFSSSPPGHASPLLSLDCSPDPNLPLTQQSSDSPREGIRQTLRSPLQGASEPKARSQIDQASESQSGQITCPALTSARAALSPGVLRSSEESQHSEDRVPTPSQNPPVTCNQNYAPPCWQNQPGDIALDLPQGPALVGPVTLLPPPPLPKGAAHMQATTLVQSQNRPTDTPMAMPPPRQHAPPDTRDWSFPPTLQPQRPAEVAKRNIASTEASYSFPSATNPGGGLSMVANLRSQSIINRSRGTNASTVLPHFTQRPLARVLPTHGVSERTQSTKTQVPATGQEPATSHVFGMGKEPLKVRVFAVSQEPVVEQSNISVVRQESSMGQEHPVDREPTVNQVPVEGQELVSVVKSSLLTPTKEAGEVQQLNLKMQRNINPLSLTHSEFEDKSATPTEHQVRISPAQGVCNRVCPVQEPWNTLKHNPPIAEPSSPRNGYETTPPIPSAQSKSANSAFIPAEPRCLLSVSPFRAGETFTQPMLPLCNLPSPSQCPPQPAGKLNYNKQSSPTRSSPKVCQSQPENIPLHASYASKTDPHNLYILSPDDKLRLRSFHHSIKFRDPRQLELPSTVYDSPVLRTGSGVTTHPAIRRVRSLHAAPTMLPKVAAVQAKFPTETPQFWLPVNPCASFEKSCQSPFHITKLQPSFENGRVQYHYQPYRSNAAPEKAADYCPSHDTFPVRREHSFISRDIPPVLESRGPAVRATWDPKERSSIKMQNSAWMKSKAHFTLQCNNTNPLPPDDLDYMEVLRLCGKLDSEKPVGLTSKKKDDMLPSIRSNCRSQPSDLNVPMAKKVERHSQRSRPASPPKLPSGSPLHRLPQFQSPQRSSVRTEEWSPPAKSKVPDKWWTEDNNSKSGQKTQSRPAYSQNPIQDRHIDRVRTAAGRHAADPALGLEVSAPCPADNHDSHSRGGYNSPQHPEKESSKTSIWISHVSPDHRRHVESKKLMFAQESGSLTPASPFGSPLSTKVYSTALGQGCFLSSRLLIPRPEAEVHTQ